MIRHVPLFIFYKVMRIANKKGAGIVNIHILANKKVRVTLDNNRNPKFFIGVSTAYAFYAYTYNIQKYFEPIIDVINLNNNIPVNMRRFGSNKVEFVVNDVISLIARDTFVDGKCVFNIQKHANKIKKIIIFSGAKCDKYEKSFLTFLQYILTMCDDQNEKINIYNFVMFMENIRVENNMLCSIS